MVTWNAEKDQIILKGIFVFHDIKNSGPLLEYLAGEIGDGCTPKAVSHRLANLRKSGKPTNSPSSGSASAPKKLSTSAVKTPRTPASGRVKSRPRTPAAKKVIDSDLSSDEIEADVEEEVVSPSVNRKRARTSKVAKSYAESDATSGDEEGVKEFMPVKKVKAEPAVEERMGNLGGVEVDGELEVDDEGVAFI